MRRVLLAGLVSACTLAAQPRAGAGAVEGHVFNSLTGEPLRKATVILAAPQIHLVDVTDAAGKFQLTGLPPGTYRLSASRAGFRDHAARRPISLGANEDVADSEIRLPPQGVIAGRVLGEDDDPSPGAIVSIYKQVYRVDRLRCRFPSSAGLRPPGFQPALRDTGARSSNICGGCRSAAAGGSHRHVHSREARSISDPVAALREG